MRFHGCGGQDPESKGIGGALLDWLEAAARTACATRVRLEARMDNEAARSFYSEGGYREGKIVRAMYSGRVDGVRRERWLQVDGRPR